MSGTKTNLTAENSAIAKVIDYINKQLDDAEKMDKALYGVLCTLKVSLETNQIAHALWCLENISLKTSGFSFFGPTGKLTKQLGKQYKPLPEWWQKKGSGSSMTEVPASTHKILGSIYVTLAEAYQPGWYHEYVAQNPEQGISFDVIDDWQKSLMKLSTTPNRAAKDMGSRGIKIKLEEGVDQTSVDSSDEIAANIKLVQLLAQSATAYDEDEKQMVEKWLQANGSQDNINIPSLLVLNKEFKFNNLKQDDGKEEDKLDIGLTTIINPTWFKDKDGSIYFEYAINVHTLTKRGGQTTIYRDATRPGDSDNAIEVNSRDLPFTSSAEIKKCPPLLEFNVKIKLVIDKDNENNKIVKPIVTKLAVKSNTDYLDVPARFQVPEQKPTNKI